MPLDCWFSEITGTLDFQSAESTLTLNLGWKRLYNELKPYGGKIKMIIPVHWATKKYTLISWDCPFKSIALKETNNVQQGRYG